VIKANDNRVIVVHNVVTLTIGNEWQLSVIKNKRGDSPKGGMPTYHRQQWFV
jgi:hypothetical protein